jgi:uncharacterized membrane protein
MRKSEIVALAMILISFIIGTYLYPQMPDAMASHWNAQGQVDGYTNKAIGLFLMPVASLGMLLLFVLVPKIDPLRRNIKKFRKYYDGFIVIIIAFMFYLYALTIAWNVGLEFDMVYSLIPAFAAIFYYSGILVENAKRNWFIGIRTPWTLSSKKVWNKTHRLGGKLFKAAALVSLLGLFFRNYAFFFLIVPIISVAGYIVVYSYVIYQKKK